MYMLHDANGQATPVIEKRQFFQILGINDAAKEEEARAIAEAQRNLTARKTESEIAENNAQAQNYGNQTEIAKRQIGLAEMKRQDDLNNPYRHVPAGNAQTAVWLANASPEQQAAFDRQNASKSNKGESIEDQARKYVAEATGRGERMDVAKENAREIYGTDGSVNSSAKNLGAKRLPDGQQVVNIGGRTYIVPESDAAAPVKQKPPEKPKEKRDPNDPNEPGISPEEKFWRETNKRAIANSEASKKKEWEEYKRKAFAGGQ
ncbi:MAG: hypothetical protein LBR95_07000 [Azoarcus sp.]|nr:hypothetical protein [Azoarcus sp.]